jgi:hypothetical protein
MLRTLWVTSLIIVLAAGSLLILLATPVRRGERCLRELKNVEVGKTTDSDLMKSEFFRTSTRECKGDRCSYSFVVNNRVASALHISEPTEITTAVTTEKGLVSDIWIHGTVGSTAPIAMVTVQQHSAALACAVNPCVKVAEKNSSGPELAWATIVFGGNGNKIGTAVNSSCLLKIGGCKDAREFMPLISNYRN